MPEVMSEYAGVQRASMPSVVVHPFGRFVNVPPDDIRTSSVEVALCSLVTETVRTLEPESNATVGDRSPRAGTTVPPSPPSPPEPVPPVSPEPPVAPGSGGVEGPPVLPVSPGDPVSEGVLGMVEGSPGEPVEPPLPGDGVAVWPLVGVVVGRCVGEGVGVPGEPPGPVEPPGVVEPPGELCELPGAGVGPPDF
jgi:hypothetical protein